jgi:hypothetical protein
MLYSARKSLTKPLPMKNSPKVAGHFDFVMLRDKFMPDSLLLTGSADSISTVDPLAHKMVADLLSEHRCSEQVHFIWAPPGGIGAKISALIKPLQWCLRHHVSVTMVDGRSGELSYQPYTHSHPQCHLKFPELPFYAHNCSVKDFSCFFKEPSNCTRFTQKCKEKRYDKHKVSSPQVQ